MKAVVKALPQEDVLVNWQGGRLKWPVLQEEKEVDAVSRAEVRLELVFDRWTYKRLEERAAEKKVSLSQLVRRVLVRELDHDDDSAVEQGLKTRSGPIFPVPEDLGELALELDPSWRADWRFS